MKAGRDVYSIVSEVSWMRCKLSYIPGPYSGTYCDICDVTEHDTEECPEQTFESVFQDGLAQIGKLAHK